MVVVPGWVLMLGGFAPRPLGTVGGFAGTTVAEGEETPVGAEVGQPEVEPVDVVGEPGIPADETLREDDGLSCNDDELEFRTTERPRVSVEADWAFTSIPPLEEVLAEEAVVGTLPGPETTWKTPPAPMPSPREGSGVVEPEEEAVEGGK